MSGDVTLFGESPFDAIRQLDDDGDFWSARDLMPLLGYERWERFEDTIDRAVFAAENSGAVAADHFRSAGKVIKGGRWGQMTVTDYRLTRYAAYLVAMNGDPRKPEIAAAQTYFAAKTREAEVAPAAFDVPRSLPEALRAYAAEVEARQIAERRATELEAPAEAWNVLASADPDYSVREAAYILNRDPDIDTGQNRLFNEMRRMRIIDSRDIPYADHARHVKLRPRSFTNRATGEETPAKPQVRITAAGLAYLHKKLGGTAPLQLDQEVDA